MSEERPLLIEASQYDTSQLLAEWRWIVPTAATPLYISALGDWVFGHPDGSLWVLSLLEGTYEQVARNSAEYNTLKRTETWVDSVFLSSWFVIAQEHGLRPGRDECLGWKVHPRLGGRFEVENLQVFSMLVYQSLMGQFHRQVGPPAAPPGERKPWYRFW